MSSSENALTLGLVGGMCSGKDSWANFLRDQYGFQTQGTSDITREYIREHDLGDLSRDNLRYTCARLRAEHGPAYLVEAALQRLESESPRLINGLYTVPEADYMRQVGGVVVCVLTPSDIQFSRMQKRARCGETGGQDEFQRLIQNDLKAPDTDQALMTVIESADYSIDGSVPIADTLRCRRIADELFEAIGVSL